MITIVTPTYNSSTLIVEQYARLRNLLSSTLNWIIVDDCSNDDTEAVVNQFDSEYIKYLRLPINQGPANARLVGVDNAITPYVFFLDVDDIIFDSYFIKFIKFISENTQFDFYFCPIYSSSKIELQRDFSSESIKEISRPTDFIKNGFPHPSSLVVKTKFYSQHIPSNDLKWGEDILLYLHMSKKGLGIRWTHPVSCYYINGGRGSVLSIRKRCALAKALFYHSIQGSKKINSLIFSSYMSVRFMVSYIYKIIFKK